MERKPAHPHDALSPKTATSLWKKIKMLGRCAEYISELFEDHRKEHNVMKCNFAGPPVMKDEIMQSNRPRQYTSGTSRST